MHESQAQNLFLAALDVPADERIPFVDRVCGQESSLRQDVLQLLEHYTRWETDPTVPAFEAEARRAAAEETTAFRGRELGNYQILDCIGTGGMAAVYKAVLRDDAFSKVVAI